VTQLRDHIVQRIWRGKDPFAQFPTTIYQVDKQGWNDQHRYLIEAIDRTQLLVIEIGVWKGGSTMKMADTMRARGINGVVISVDTWLGSVEHWVQDDWWAQLGMMHGYPNIQRKFMANVVDSGLQDYVVPLPVDSINAAEIIKSFGIQADVIHIDAGHDYWSVMSDLTAWWPVLKAGGLYIGDDYNADGAWWPGVYEAHNDFFEALGITKIEHTEGKCRIRKKLGANLVPRVRTSPPSPTWSDLPDDAKKARG
jgi:hypothetical protein